MKTKIKILLALSFLLAVASQASAFDIVSSPTDDQKWIFYQKLMTASASTETVWCPSYGGYSNTLVGFYLSGTLISTHDNWWGDSGDPKAHVTADRHLYGNNQSIILFQSEWYKQCGYQSPSIEYTLYNLSNGLAYRFPIWTVFFIGASNYVLVVNGSNLEYRTLNETTMTLSAPVQTVPLPQVENLSDGMWDAIVNSWDTFWNSSNVAFQSPRMKVIDSTTGKPFPELPVFFKRKDYKLAWFYRWNDNNIYTLYFDPLKLYRSPHGQNTTPIWPVVFDSNLSILYARDNTASGTLAIENYQANLFRELAKPNAIDTHQFGTWDRIKSLGSLTGSVLYLNTSNGWKAWDLNCKTAGYDSCRLKVSDGSYFCGNSSGVASPNAEICGTPLGSAVFGTGSTGSGSSSGSWSTTGSWTSSVDQYGYVAYSWSTLTYTPVPQTCAPKVFSGTTTLSNTTADLQPNTCAWRSASWAYRCQDVGGHACTTSGDACLQEISNPGQYTWSWVATYSWDITKYECTAKDTQCKWTDKNTCWPQQYCYVDGNYCRIKPEAIPIDLTGSGELTIPSLTANNSISTITNLIWNVKGDGVVTSSGGALGSYSWNTLLNEDMTNWSCDMFNTDWSFAYYSDSLPLHIDLSLSQLTDNSAMQAFLKYPDTVIHLFTNPINNIVSIFRTFWVVPEGTKICYFWATYTVVYQHWFKIADEAKATLFWSRFALLPVNKLTFIDYFALFFWGLICLFCLVKIIKPSS